jgi:hypothetical protein
LYANQGNGTPGHNISPPGNTGVCMEENRQWQYVGASIDFAAGVATFVRGAYPAPAVVTVQFLPLQDPQLAAPTGTLGCANVDSSVPCLVGLLHSAQAWPGLATAQDHMALANSFGESIGQKPFQPAAQGPPTSAASATLWFNGSVTQAVSQAFAQPPQIDQASAVVSSGDLLACGSGSVALEMPPISLTGPKPGVLGLLFDRLAWSCPSPAADCITALLSVGSGSDPVIVTATNQSVWIGQPQTHPQLLGTLPDGATTAAISLNITATAVSATLGSAIPNATRTVLVSLQGAMGSAWARLGNGFPSASASAAPPSPWLVNATGCVGTNVAAVHAIVW